MKQKTNGELKQDCDLGLKQCNGIIKSDNNSESSDSITKTEEINQDVKVSNSVDNSETAENVETSQTVKVDKEKDESDKVTNSNGEVSSANSENENVNKDPSAKDCNDENTENKEENMDAKLPMPEHMTTFYDVVKAVQSSNSNLTAQEIETKFKQISLAFKTDRLTLKQRLDVQQRQRDIAEGNFEREILQLRNSILALHEDCIDLELVDTVAQLRKHLDILSNSSSSLLSASEVWGAVQQEWRVSRALEVLLLHVENVKRLYENDHQELEEMKKILVEHNIEIPNAHGSSNSNQQSHSEALSSARRSRTSSLAGVLFAGVGKQSQEGGSRRISIVGPNAAKNLKDYLGSRGSRRRASLMPDLLSYQSDFAAIAAAASAKAAKEKEEKSQAKDGALGNSNCIDEGSESGDEGNSESRTTASNETATATPEPQKMPRIPINDLLTLGDSDNGSDEEDEDDDSSNAQLPLTEPLVQNDVNESSLTYQLQLWLLLCINEISGWVRGGQWPYSSRQTFWGARYALTTLLLIIAVFLVIATLSSGDSRREPCLPNWNNFDNILHPFVTVCRLRNTPSI